MTKREKVMHMKNNGYTFKVKRVGDSKVITIAGQFTKKGSELEYWYSLEWTEEEIIIDVIDKVLEWAGYRVVERLELF